MKAVSGITERLGGVCENRKVLNCIILVQYAEQKLLREKGILDLPNDSSVDDSRTVKEKY